MTSTRDLAEQVVQLQKKKPKVKSLKDNSGFAVRQKAQLGDAWAYAWLDFSLVMEVVIDEIDKRRDPDAEPNPLVPQPERILEALGLLGLNGVSVSASSENDGSLLEINLNVPKAQRRGLFEMLATPAKNADRCPLWLRMFRARSLAAEWRAPCGKPLSTQLMRLLRLPPVPWPFFRLRCRLKTLILISRHS